ncbi:MAG: MmgE/PrpD family protein [Rhodospirillaceae bacterium]|nr:MmgE/PrpD family protein [Rhodospirillaceae bacterium]MYB12273.1 MmgE/PrpD family protein [Rhodospirillaceae bacterium]MYI47682.1 MmgE/PrpD family protein [Rhodospirillaceae bacterium]
MTAPADRAAARILADWTAGLQWTDVPDSQHPLIGLRVLDTLGLVLAGASTDAAAAARAVAGRQGKSGEAGLLPEGSRAAAAWAAFVHGVTAHCRDFDDTFPDSVVHPGSVVVPAALAVGEATGAADTDIAAAIVAGYEVAARLGRVAGRRFHVRGLHATGIVGPFAAAAAAGRLTGLDGAAIANAFGLAGSMAGGLMAFVADGSWSKWLHAGWAAHGGIVAAQMAAEGFRGPAGVLDGRHNLYAALLDGEDVPPASLTEGLGADWRGADAHFKYYPCAHVIQPYLDAAIDLRREHGLTGRDIAGGVCRIAPWAAQIVCAPRPAKIRPDNEMAAIASLPYLLAVALAEGAVTLDALDAPSRTDPAILDLAARLTHEEDPALGRGFDGVLILDCADGRRFERPASSAPPDAGKVLAKFRANARRASAPPDIEALERAAIGSPLPDFRRLFALLR